MNSKLPCPDAYLDHRNNLICPHAPKRLKSVRQRCAEVLQEFKKSLRRWSDSESVHDLSAKPQLLWSADGNIPNARLTVRAAICAPITSPFAHLIILLHTLFFIQALSLLIEDALIKDACSSSLAGSFRSSSSWSKIWSRFRFRFRNQWSKRSFWEPFVFWLLSLSVIFAIARETVGESGSWQTGGVWHDLPFRQRCQTAAAMPSQPSSPHTSEAEIRISIIGLRALKLLSFLLDRAPFLKPARSLILIECAVGLVCLCQPAQHFLPQRLIPKSLRVPRRFLQHNAPPRAWPDSRLAEPARHSAAGRHNWSQVHQDDHPADPPTHQPGLVVEVETKWVLSVLVEACVCVAAIASYVVVMVSVPRILQHIKCPSPFYNHALFPFGVQTSRFVSVHKKKRTGQMMLLTLPRIFHTPFPFQCSLRTTTMTGPSTLHILLLVPAASLGHLH